MAKKGKEDAPNANAVPNRDILQRLNFLYQASVYLNTVPSSQKSKSTSSSTSDTTASGRRKKRSLAHVVNASELSRSYIETMKAVGQKATVKIDPGVKRTLCKRCDLILIPGSTATVRIKKSPIHGHLMVYKCTGCKTSRKIPAPPTLKTDDISASNDLTSSALGATIPETTAPGTLASAMTGIETQSDAAQEKHDLDSKKGARKKRRRNAQARVPPLFARNIGHVVYCGNEKLVDNGFGDGVYIT